MTPTPAKTPGPQVGTPPSLEQIAVSRLNVEPTYQRNTDSDASRKIIAGMVRQWDWTLCQPLTVARRADGSLWVLDGQHRRDGAIERGDIPFLPCTVSSSLDHKAEARTFVELNTRRQKLTQGQIFHGMLAAGDPEAKRVQDLLDQTGWRVMRHTNTAAYKPGDLECAPMLARLIATRGEPHARFALTVLRAAWPDTPVRQSATMIKAIVELFDHVDDSRLTARKLIDAIGAIEPVRWFTRGAAEMDRHPGLSQITAIARAMMAAARGEAPTNAARPVIAIAPATPAKPAPSPIRPTRAAPASDRVFGTSGKGWCTQCERLKAREAAAACADRHCKLRPHT